MTQNEIEIPSIDRIEFDAFAEDTVVSDEHREVAKMDMGDASRIEEDISEIRIILETGARLVYEWLDENTVSEKIYRPEDVEGGVYDHVHIDLHHGGYEDFIACVRNSVEAYEDGVRDDYNLFREKEDRHSLDKTMERARQSAKYIAENLTKEENPVYGRLEPEDFE